MLSPRAIRAYDLVFTITSIIKSLPFGWNLKNPSAKMHVLQGTARWLAYLNFVLDSCVMFGIIAGLGQFIVTNRRNLGLIIPPFVFIGGFGFITVAKFGAWLYRYELANLGSQVAEVCERLSREFHHRRSASVKILEYGSAGFALISSTIPVAAFGYQLNDPTNLYWFYFGPDWAGQLAYASLSAIFICNQIVVLIFMVLITFAPLCTITYWLDETMNSLQTRARTPRQVLHSYTAIQTFAHLAWDATCSLIITSYLFMGTLLVIGGPVLLILFYNSLSWIIILVMADIILFVFGAFHFCFTLQTACLLKSEQLLRLVQFECKNKYNRRLHKCKVPIRAYFSNFFKTKPATKLTLFGFIFENIGTTGILMRSKTLSYFEMLKQEWLEQSVQ